MPGFSLLDLSSALGLAATGVLTVNLLLGMLLSTAYGRNPYWKRLPARVRHARLDRLHNWTAYVALGLVALHPALLLFDPATKFTLPDILWPVHAPHQRLFVALGAAAFYALLLVLISTQKAVKRRLGHRRWKALHLVSYATALLFLVHGVAMDPLLKDRPIDFFDAEKILSEGCLLVLAVATAYRIRYQRARRPRPIAA